jgi:transposase
VSRNGRISKHGDRMTRTDLYKAANALMTRNIGGGGLRDWARAIEKKTGPPRAKVALARKLAVILHAMWRTGTPFEDRMAI